MYNRYIPDADGIYRRRIIPEPERAAQEAEIAESVTEPPPVCRSTPPVPRRTGLPLPQLDSGDLLVLLILILILVDSDDGCGLTPLVAIAAFILMQ